MHLTKEISTSASKTQPTMEETKESAIMESVQGPTVETSTKLYPILLDIVSVASGVGRKAHYQGNIYVNLN